MQIVNVLIVVVFATIGELFLCQRISSHVCTCFLPAFNRSGCKRPTIDQKILFLA